MKACEPDSDGFINNNGVKIHYEVYGAHRDGPTILLLPTWTIVHKRFWKAQLPYLSRHFRVLTYDGPGNGKSDRPIDPAPYDQHSQVHNALGVLDATGTGKAVMVGLSRAAYWAADLAANHKDRVHGTVLIGPSIMLKTATTHRDSAGLAASSSLPRSMVELLGTDPLEHWSKYDADYWRKSYDDFLWFFFGQCFTERRSTKQIEDCVGWGRETTADVLIAEKQGFKPSAETVREWLTRIDTPLITIHGDQDAVSAIARSIVVTELSGGELVTIEGGGHMPQARDPVKVNHIIRDFSERFRGTRKRHWVHGRNRRKRVLYISSPIGLGHARRDVAIAKELRKLHEDIQIDWLAQHPVTKVLEGSGEHLHPASVSLASESKHIESESGEHDLHCFEALRRMDEVLVSNFMVFDDVVRETDYDLVVGDEAWDVDHFLHENPELKRYAYAWLTDFVGYLPMPDDTERGRLVAADYNAEMIEHIEHYPRIRDRAIFVGDPEEIVPHSFGDNLPLIREWTEQHYDFCGYVTGIDPSAVGDRAALRRALGWSPDQKVCVVTVGGSGVGTHLLRRVSDAYEAVRGRVDGLRMIVVAGPRIDAGIIRPRPGLDVHEFVPDLYRQLAASDLAVVQGGLTTTMELTAAGRPFIYIPLRHHFEQNFHVAHRLDRYGAGRRLDYEAITPDALADAIAEEIGRETSYRPVADDGAARAAALLAELL
jgi:pimeloyl-ACP methyl ester carboxylesterase/predicted glycosyltransferase